MVTVTKVTELVKNLNGHALILRQILSVQNLELALALMEQLLEDL